MARRKPGLPLLDLTTSNPYACEFSFDAAAVLQPLSDPASLGYHPDPLGSLSAREAVVRYYGGHGAALGVKDIVLTASTSEAYSHLFRLFCDPGDEVLVAQPSYPLFDFLAGLSDVVLKPYPLFYDHGWWIDFAELERRITDRTRAIVVVHPNNPTGHLTSDTERSEMERLCVAYGLALIVDEVFLDYAHDPGLRPRSFAMAPSPVLTCVLSGLSKIAALPQMKLAWIALTGPATVRAEAQARLEIIADTFLSVNTPAQFALPAWMEQAPLLQRQIRSRVAENLTVLRGAVLRGKDPRGAGITLLQVEAGWSAILQLPRTFAERNASAALLELGIITHPGEFYGLHAATQCVASLIVPVARTVAAMDRLRSSTG